MHSLHNKSTMCIHINTKQYLLTKLDHVIFRIVYLSINVRHVIWKKKSEAICCTAYLFQPILYTDCHVTARANWCTEHWLDESKYKLKIFVNSFPDLEKKILRKEIEWHHSIQPSLWFICWETCSIRYNGNTLLFIPYN